MSQDKTTEEKIAQAQAILGYEFKNKDYLLSAITHPSASEEMPSHCSYERLEFLGDSIVGFILAARTFDEYPDLDEGGLTRIKVALESGQTLSDIASTLGFAEVIVFGSSEAGTGKRGLHSALENVYEAVVGALFLDGGLKVAKAFVERTLIPLMDVSLAQSAHGNPKSLLQEKLQAIGLSPVYEIIDTQGPPHDRVFEAQVKVGEIGMGCGYGRTKKEAENEAATKTLEALDTFLKSLPLEASFNH